VVEADPGRLSVSKRGRRGEDVEPRAIGRGKWLAIECPRELLPVQSCPRHWNQGVRTSRWECRDPRPAARQPDPGRSSRGLERSTWSALSPGVLTSSSWILQGHSTRACDYCDLRDRPPERCGRVKAGAWARRKGTPWGSLAPSFLRILRGRFDDVKRTFPWFEIETYGQLRSRVQSCAEVLARV